MARTAQRPRLTTRPIGDTAPPKSIRRSDRLRANSELISTGRESSSDVSRFSECEAHEVNSFPLFSSHIVPIHSLTSCIRSVHYF